MIMLFTTPFSSSLYLLTVRNICHWEKKREKKSANKTGNEGRARQRKKSQKNYSVITGLFLFFFTPRFL